MPTIFNNRIKIQADYLRRFMAIAQDPEKIRQALQTRYRSDETEALLFAEPPLSLNQLLEKIKTLPTTEDRANHVFGETQMAAGQEEIIDPRDQQLSLEDRIILDAIQFQVTTDIKNKFAKDLEDSANEKLISEAWKQLSDDFLTMGGLQLPTYALGLNYLPLMTQDYLRQLRIPSGSGRLFTVNANQVELNRTVFEPWMIATRPAARIDPVYANLNKQLKKALDSNGQYDGGYSRVLNECAITDREWNDFYQKRIQELYQKYNPDNDPFALADLSEKIDKNPEHYADLDELRAMVIAKAHAIVITREGTINPALKDWLNKTDDKLYDQAVGKIGKDAFHDALTLGVALNVIPQLEGDLNELGPFAAIVLSKRVQKVIENKGTNPIIMAATEAVGESSASAATAAGASTARPAISAEAAAPQRNALPAIDQRGRAKNSFTKTLIKNLATAAVITGGLLVGATIGAGIGFLVTGWTGVGLAAGIGAGAAIGGAAGLAASLAALGTLNLASRIFSRLSKPKNGYEPLPTEPPTAASTDSSRHLAGLGGNNPDGQSPSASGRLQPNQAPSKQGNPQTQPEPLSSSSGSEHSSDPDSFRL